MMNMIDNEICYVLRGDYITIAPGKIKFTLCCAYADPALLFSGKPAEVDFDYKKVYAVEDECHDVVGFLHTHPGMSAIMSSQDKKTMKGWVTAFDKELLCVIKGKNRSQAYRFDKEGHWHRCNVYSRGRMFFIIL